MYQPPKEYSLELSTDGDLLDIAFDDTFIQVDKQQLEDLISDLEDILIVMKRLD